MLITEQERCKRVFDLRQFVNRRNPLGRVSEFLCWLIIFFFKILYTLRCLKMLYDGLFRY